ncbi:MAG TPA: hypothetical protein DEQ14_02415 [Treponema sp.]|nr:hypothetical protein [Treponema sp.]
MKYQLGGKIVNTELTQKKLFRNKIIFKIIILAVLAVCVNRIRLFYVENAVEQGNIAYEQGNYDMAIPNYTLAINLMYQKSSNLLWRGRAHYGKNDFDMAIADFTKGIELSPNDTAHYLWRGRTYQKKREYDKAILDFTEAIRLDKVRGSRTYFYFTERGDVYFAKGNYDLALLDYKQAVEVIDNMISVYSQKGWDSEDLYQKRDEIAAEINYVERRKNNVPSATEEDVLNALLNLFGGN